MAMYRADQDEMNARRESLSGLLMFVQATTGYAFTAIFLPLTIIKHDLGLEMPSMLLITAAYGFSYSGLLLLGVQLCDRVGTRRMILTSLLTFATASIGVALSPDYTLLVSMRFMQGAGAAFLTSSTISSLRTLRSPRPAFERTMMKWTAASAIGAVTGCILPGILLTWISSRWIVALPAVLSTLGMMIFSKYKVHFPQDEDARDKDVDITGALFSTVCISIGGYSILVTDSGSSLSGSAPLYLLAGTIFLIPSLTVERKDHALFQRSPCLLNRSRAIGLMGVMLGIAGLGSITYVVLLRSILSVHRWIPADAAMELVPPAATLLLTAKVARKLVDKTGPWVTTLIGMLLTVPGMSYLGHIDYIANDVDSPLLALMLVMFGTSLTAFGSVVLSTNRTRIDQRCSVTNWLSAAVGLGQLIGMVVVMYVVAPNREMLSSVSRVFGILGLLFALNAVITFREMCYASLQCRIPRDKNY